MSSLFVLLCLIIVISIPPAYGVSDGIQLDQCWDTITSCITEESGGFYMNKCRLRCQCLGFRTGYCRIVRYCDLMTRTSWACHCQGQLSRFHNLLLDLCKDVDATIIDDQ